MLGKIKKIIGANQLVPTSEIFPQIDVKLLKIQLNPAKKGKERGINELPSSDSLGLDSFEQEIVATVENLRQQCINEYHNHKTVYSNRLSEVSTARTEIEASTTMAPGAFMTDSKEFESQLQSSTVRLRECAVWKHKFRKEHRIERAGHHYTAGGLKWFFFGILMLLLESILNAPMLARQQEMGLFGGGLTALLISLANVGFSSVIGFYSRLINSIKPLKRIFGFLILLVWFITILGFNFGVAHFRDGIVAKLSWDEAARNAVVSLQTPLNLTHIESWLLVVLGCLISLVALLKGYYADDPYPGYGNLERQLDKARVIFTQDHSVALHKLVERREKIVQDMKEAEELVRLRVNELNDALFGDRSLDIKFKEHLNHCDKVVQQLLQVYRDNNEEVRKTPHPVYFKDKYAFEEVPIYQVERSKSDKLSRELKQIEELVSSATKEILQLWKKSIMNFPSARDIEKI